MEDPRAKNSKDSIEKVSEFSLKTHSHIRDLRLLLEGLQTRRIPVPSAFLLRIRSDPADETPREPLSQIHGVSGLIALRNRHS